MDSNLNEVFNQKDKRISWLSIFSSLCGSYQGKEATVFSQLEDVAHEINKRLYQAYPFPENMQQNTKPMQQSRYNSKPTKEGETCACGLPRIYKQGVKIKPDGTSKPWRGLLCQNKKCDPIWLPNLKEMERSNFEDQITDDANKAPEYDGGY